MRMSNKSELGIKACSVNEAKVSPAFRSWKDTMTPFPPTMRQKKVETNVHTLWRTVSIALIRHIGWQWHSLAAWSWLCCHRKQHENETHNELTLKELSGKEQSRGTKVGLGAAASRCSRNPAGASAVAPLLSSPCWEWIFQLKAFRATTRWA